MHKSAINPGIIRFDKPLFIPLNATYYDEFAAGIKTREYRFATGPWNLTNVYTGRRVTLSRGYGKKNRLTGVVENVWLIPYYSLPVDMQFTAFKLYGHKIQPLLNAGKYAMFLVIEIEVDHAE